MRENKSYRHKLSKEIAMPVEVAEKYKQYCELTKMKLSEPLRVMVLESIPQLHNAKNLDEIIVKTRSRDMNSTYEKFYVRLPSEVMDEVNIFCKFFKINWKRCHFLYFVIEERLIKTIEDMLGNEQN